MCGVCSTTSTTATTTTTTTIDTNCDADQLLLTPSDDGPKESLCRDANLTFTSQLLLRSSIQMQGGQGSVNPWLERSSDGKYTTSMLLATGVVGGSVAVAPRAPSAALPTVKSQPVACAAAAVGLAAHGLLRSTTVYYDQPSVDVTLQIYDTETFAVTTMGTSVTVYLKPKAGSNLEEQSATGVCNGKVRGGICHLSVPIDAKVFTSISAPAEFAVEYLLAKGKSGERKAVAGKVYVLPKPTELADTVVNTVYTVVPSRPLFAGDVFELEVRSRFQSYVKTAEVQLVVGSALEMVYDRSYPTAAKSSAGAAIFEQSKIDGDASKVYAVLAGRRDDKKVGQGPATDELLFTVRVRVKSNVASGGTSTVQITKIQGFRDLKETTMSTATAGLAESRSGWEGGKKNTPAKVHFEADVVLRLFGYASGPSELLNTAMITGISIGSPLRLLTVSARGSTLVITGACQSTNNAVLKSKNCVATLDGTETTGSPKINIVMKAGGLETSVAFRIHGLSSLKLVVGKRLLQPLSGWFDGSDARCQTLMYPPVSITAVASFSDGIVKVFTNFAASQRLKLSSSNSDIFALDHSQMATSAYSQMFGKSEGDATLYLKDAQGKVWDQKVISVTDQSPAHQLAVVGLDAIAVAELGAVELAGSSPYSRNQRVGVTITPMSASLKYVDNSIGVAASAVLDDGSRVVLNANNGLVLSSLNARSIKVVGERAVVPFDPVGHDGPLVHVAWQPNNDCYSNNGTVSARAAVNMSLTVSPPPADSLIVVAGNTPIVCAQDPAAGSGVGLASTDQLKVSLLFPKGVMQENLQTDARVKVHYDYGGDAAFSISAEGLVTAKCSSGAAGTSDVTVRIEGQNVTAKVSIAVVKFVDLVVAARPFPTYSDSNGVDASRLSRIKCTASVYQQAQIYVKMKLSDGQLTNEIDSQHVTVAINGGRLVHAGQYIMKASSAGTSAVTATIGNAADGVTSRTPLSIVVDNDDVTVNSVDGAALIQQGKKVTTLRGEKDVATAQIMAGLTFSDGRKFPIAITAGGTPQLPGLLGFSSSVSDEGLTIEVDTGKVTLVGNHHATIDLIVTTCQSSDDAAEMVRINVACNLDPVQIGDVDLGAEAGLPFPTSLEVDDQFKVPLRVNTAGLKLAYFDLIIQFDPKAVEFVKIEPSVASLDGNVLFSSGILPSGNQIAIVGTIADSKVQGDTTGVELFQLTFKIKAKGKTSISGYVMQLLDATPGAAKTISGSDDEFVAGNVVLNVGGRARRQRGRQRLQGRTVRSGLQQPGHHHQSTGPNTINRNRRDMAIELGDANCDGEFNGLDVLFILDYVATRGNGFSTELGGIMQYKVRVCQDKGDKTDVGFLDTDANGEVNLLDLTYMLDVKAGNFFFMTTTASVQLVDTCTYEIVVSCTVVDARGDAARKGTRVLFDLGFPQSDSTISPLLESSTNTVSLSKGNSKLYGGLVEATVDTRNSQLFTAVLRTTRKQPFDFSKMGISVLQVASKPIPNGPQVKFFSGSPTKPAYVGTLTYSAKELGINAPLTVRNGYNPLLTGINTPNLPEHCGTSTTTTTTVTSTTTTTTSTTASSTTTTFTTLSTTTVSSSTVTTLTTTSATRTTTTTTATTTTVTTTTVTATTTVTTTTMTTTTRTTTTYTSTVTSAPPSTVAPISSGDGAIGGDNNAFTGESKAEKSSASTTVAAIIVGFILVNLIAWFTYRKWHKRNNPKASGESESGENGNIELKGVHGNLINLALQNPAYADSGELDDNLDMFTSNDEVQENEAMSWLNGSTDAKRSVQLNSKSGKSVAKSLGFHLKAFEHGSGFVIRSVVAGGLAAKSEDIHVGDFLYSVNGADTTRYTNIKKIGAVIRSAGERVTMVVGKPPAQSCGKSATLPTSDLDTEDDHNTEFGLNGPVVSPAAFLRRLSKASVQPAGESTINPVVEGDYFTHGQRRVSVADMMQAANLADYDGVEDGYAGSNTQFPIADHVQQPDTVVSNERVQSDDEYRDAIFTLDGAMPSSMGGVRRETMWNNEEDATNEYLAVEGSGEYLAVDATHEEPYDEQYQYDGGEAGYGEEELYDEEDQPDDGAEGGYAGEPYNDEYQANGGNEEYQEESYNYSPQITNFDLEEAKPYLQIAETSFDTVAAAPPSIEVAVSEDEGSDDGMAYEC
jgi:hypothetical protein